LKLDNKFYESNSVSVKILELLQCRAYYIRAMTSKSKRALSIQEDGNVDDGSSPAKRARTEKSHTVFSEHNNQIESPAQIDEEDFVDNEETAIPVAPTPVVDDLYLETVNPQGGTSILTMTR
jgi:hypothetical protein